MKRRTLEETRALLLDTAVGMVTEAGRDATIGKLDLLEVCRQAGLTSAGSAYKIWPTQDDYRVDLLRHVFDGPPERPAIDTVAEAVANSPTEPPPLSEVILLATESTPAERTEQDREFALYIALWIASIHDDGLAGVLAESDRQALDELAAFHDALAKSYGLEWIPPFDAHLFATLVSAAIEGAAVERHAAPIGTDRTLTRRSADTGVERDWSILACSIEALVGAFTRPRGNP